LSKGKFKKGWNNKTLYNI